MVGHIGDGEGEQVHSTQHRIDVAEFVGISDLASEPIGKA